LPICPVADSWGEKSVQILFVWDKTKTIWALIVFDCLIGLHSCVQSLFFLIFFLTLGLLIFILHLAWTPFLCPKPIFFIIIFLTLCLLVFKMWKFEFGHSAFSFLFYTSLEVWVWTLGSTFLWKCGVHIRYKNKSSQYRTGSHFGLVRGIKYFSTGQYQCTVSGLPLYI
jgi:predicted ABC-type exoprotein transport system permease subunit